jgi:histone H3/H4
MINEILAKKEIKRLIKHGISKVEAKRIVDEVMKIVDSYNEDIVRNAISYAVSLTYIISFSKIIH